VYILALYIYPINPVDKARSQSIDRSIVVDGNRIEQVCPLPPQDDGLCDVRRRPCGSAPLSFLSHSTPAEPSVGRGGGMHSLARCVDYVRLQRLGQHGDVPQ
jgi:hypothetical protein